MSLLPVFCVSRAAKAQDPQGALDFTARITPTAARPEPVRQFTFYLLTKSYSDISHEVEAQDATPSRDKFIDNLKLSPAMKAWLKSHDVFDLATPGLDRILTPDDIVQIPEFLVAYQRSNSGGVTTGMPKPKYKDADKTENPARYQKQREEYLIALKKFVQLRPETVSGTEMELDPISPQRQWSQIQAEHKKRVSRLAPDVAQTRYLAAKADTDLDGRAFISGLPAGTYWVSTLNLDAAAGDMQMRWDVPITIQAGRTARVELTNLNGRDPRGATP